MSDVRPVCGIPCCSNPDEEQTTLSIGLRITFFALGVLLTIVGVLILFNIPGLSHMGTTTGWSLTSVGVFLMLVSASTKLVKLQSQDEGTITCQKKTENSQEPTCKQNLPVNTLVQTQIPLATPIFEEAKEILAIRPEFRILNFVSAFGPGGDKPQKLQELVGEEGIQLLRDLSPNFWVEHWDALTDEQVLTMLNYRFTSTIRAESQSVRTFRLHDKVNHRMSLLFDQKPDVFYVFCEFWSETDWNKFLEFKKKAGDTEGDWIRTLDFSRLSKAAFRKFSVFVLFELPSILPTFGVKAEGFKKIEDLKRHWGVSMTHPGNWWAFLSPEQAILVAKNFGHFTQGFTEAEQKMVFSHLFGHTNQDQEDARAKARRLALLGVDSEGLQILYGLSVFFSHEHYEHGLSWEQKTVFDFPSIGQHNRRLAFDNLFGFQYQKLTNLNEQEVLIVAKRFREIKGDYKGPKIMGIICNAFRNGRSDAIKEQLNIIFQD